VDESVRVLGIDASLRSTGYGVVELRGGRFSSVEYGTIRTAADRPVSECLRRLFEGLSDVITRLQPSAASLEGGFFFKNVGTAIVLGQTRGVAVAACALRDVPVYEYPPRKVKQAVVGFGGAEKEQVRQMIMRMLSLAEAPPLDASDALSLAVCHLNHRSGHAQLQHEPV